MHSLEAWITHLAGQWWVHVVVAAFACIDSFFPMVPSESVLVTLGSLWSATGKPLIYLTFLAGWIGACCGDHITYWIGRKIGWRRFSFFQKGKGASAIALAERGLDRHAFVYFMTARFIPLGRTAVNLVAGAVGYPRQGFTMRIVAATGVWSLYSVSIGAVAGYWFEKHPLAGIVVALVVALVISLLAERLVDLLHRILALPKVWPRQHREEGGE